VWAWLFWGNRVLFQAFLVILWPTRFISIIKVAWGRLGVNQGGMTLPRALLLAAATTLAASLEAISFDFTFSDVGATQTLTGTIDVDALSSNPGASWWTPSFGTGGSSNFTVNSLAMTLSGTSTFDGAYSLADISYLYLSVPSDLNQSIEMVGQTSLIDGFTFGDQRQDGKGMFLIFDYTGLRQFRFDYNQSGYANVQLRDTQNYNSLGPTMLLTSFRPSGPSVLPTTISTTINASDARVTGGNALQFQGGAFAPGGGSALSLTNAITVLASSTGTLDATSQDITSTGAVTINGTSLTLTGSATSVISLAGLVSGTGGLINDGGVNTLAQSSTYTGATVVNAGKLIQVGTSESSSNQIAAGATLEFNQASGSVSSGNTTFTGAGILLKTGAGSLGWGVTSATFSFSHGAMIHVAEGNFIGGSNWSEVWTDNHSDLRVEAGARFSGVEADVRIDRLLGAGVVSTGLADPRYHGFTTGVDGGDGFFTGTIIDSDTASGALGKIIKVGGGELTLTGINTYGGGTTLQAGALRAGNNAAFGSGTISLNAGVLSSDGSAARTLANEVHIAGDVTLGDAVKDGALTLAGAVSVSSGTIITFASDVTLSGTATSTGVFTKAGTGVLTLDAAGTIAAGTLVVSGGLLTNNGAINGDVTVASGSTLNGTGTVTGLVTIAGAGAAGQAGALVFGAPTAGYVNSSHATMLSDDAKIALNGDGQHYHGGAIAATTAGVTLTIDTGAGMFYPDGGIGANIAHVIKEGSGILYVRSVVAGDVTVNAGTYYAGRTGATGAGVTVNAGAHLELSTDWGTPVNYNSPLALAGTNALSFVVAANLTQSGQVTLNADSSISSGFALNTISGDIVGVTSGQNLTLDISGLCLTLTGTTASSVAQVTKTGAGVLCIDTTGVINSASIVVSGGLLTNNGAINGDVTVASGSTLNGTGTVTGLVTIAGTGAAGQAGALVFDLGASPIISNSAVGLSGDAKIGVTATGVLYLNGAIDASAAGKVLTIDTGLGVVFQRGQVGTNVAQLVKEGAGWLNLRDSVAGSLVLNQGACSAAVAGSTGTGVTVKAGASLWLSSAAGTPITFAAPLSLNGSYALHLDSTAAVTQSGQVTLVADTTIASLSANHVISGGIAGATPGLNLTLKVDDHSLTLTGTTAASIAQLTKTGAGTLLVDTTGLLDAVSIVISDGLVTNNGTITGTISVTGNGVLGGSGTINGAVTINGILAPGNSPGIQIQASGDTTLATGAHYQAQLGGTTPGNGDGFHDQYDVQAGRLFLDPGVTLDVLPWVMASPNNTTNYVPKRTDVFTILKTTGGISGVFSDITNANGSQWVLFDNAPTTHLLGKLYGTGLNGNETFAAYGSTPARAALGASLWSAAVTASTSSTNAHPAGFIDGDTAFGQIAIALLTAPDADAFLDGLSPSAYLAVGDYALTVSRSLTDAAFAQSSLIRTGAWTVGAGYNRAEHGYAGANTPSYSLSSDTSLVTVAYDFSPNCSVGFFFGQNRGKTTAETSRIDYRGSVFGLTSVGRINGAYPVTLKGAVVASDLELNATRGGSASGAQKLRSFGGQLTASAEIYKDGRLTVSPTLGFVQGRSTTSAFAEAGTGANLTIDAMAQDSSRVVAGFGLTYLASTNLVFDLSAAFEHEYATDAGSVSATFGGVGTPLTVTRPLDDRDSTTCGLGASWKLDNSTTVRLGAEVRGNRELRKDYRYNASVNVRF
jgi:autotransporter-associated beta strand protein